MSINIKVIDENGQARTATWDEDQTLLDALLAHQFPVLATCGGNASCATCHAFIDPEHYPAGGQRSEAEEDLLDMLDDVATEYSRLSCQTEYAQGLDGATITLKPGM
ncbi:MAG: 2Fe-2S iron-sulfur cluster-binding protein [Rothia sp. (in: high G+C Gram-positive bacteria)]|nr:2Fe-2S iron-sulfur cluster-binding protein [Rothia sp. (in: high G+C Gram-positive bacteria)]